MPASLPDFLPACHYTCQTASLPDCQPASAYLPLCLCTSLPSCLPPSLSACLYFCYMPICLSAFLLYPLSGGGLYPPHLQAVNASKIRQWRLLVKAEPRRLMRWKGSDVCVCVLSTFVVLIPNGPSCGCVISPFCSDVPWTSCGTHTLTDHWITALIPQVPPLADTHTHIYKTRIVASYQSEITCYNHPSVSGCH